jgi:hypothetical protein
MGLIIRNNGKIFCNCPAIKPKPGDTYLDDEIMYCLIRKGVIVTKNDGSLQWWWISRASLDVPPKDVLRHTLGLLWNFEVRDDHLCPRSLLIAVILLELV